MDSLKASALATDDGNFVPNLFETAPSAEIVTKTKDWHDTVRLPTSLRGQTRPRRGPSRLLGLVFEYYIAYGILKDLPRAPDARHRELERRMPAVLNRLVPNPQRALVATMSSVLLRRLTQTHTSNRELTGEIVARILGIEVRTLERELNRGRKHVPKDMLKIWKRDGLELVQSS